MQGSRVVLQPTHRKYEGDWYQDPLSYERGAYPVDRSDSQFCVDTAYITCVC